MARKTKAQIESEIGFVMQRKSGARIRVGTRGRIVDVDGSRAAALFDGARARVLQRLYRPDAVIVELLNEGPVWHRGQVGQLEIRYFIPESGS
jgi:hypothetical protein